MTKSIRWRMVIIFVELVTIVMIISGTLIVYQMRNKENEKIEEALLTTAKYIDEWIVVDSQPVTEIEAQAKEFISGYQTGMRNQKVFLLDEGGNVIYSNSPATKEQRFYTAQVMGALTLQPVSEFDELHLSEDEAAYIGYAKSIVKGDRVVFVIYIVSSTLEVQEQVRSMLMIVALAILLAIVLAIVLSFLFSIFLTKPISALSLKAREMAEGKWDSTIEVHSEDEIGKLSENFNQMAASLNNSMFQMASEKNKMETVITHMTDGILVFDNYGMVIHKNPAAVRMLKLKGETSYREILQDRVDIKYRKILQEIEITTQRSTIDLGETYYSVDFARYVDNDATTLGIICVIQDITEHKKIENMQKEFVANVSHELRTPLTTIKSYAETLSSGAVDDLETANAFLSVINNESDRMAALVKDLLELSRIDSKKTVLEQEVINLSRLVFHSVENYRIHAKKKNQDLTMEGVEGEYLILGDANRLEQVLKNLLSNAVKYSSEGGSIHIILSSNRRYHKVSVKDTGFGIPEEDLPHIFDRFYRVDKARSRAMGGTGLGLAIAKEIVEMHKGFITVKSVLGEGTAFELYFPIFQDEFEENESL